MNNQALSGIVSLSDLYTFTRQNCEDQEALRLERTALGRQYSQLCDQVTEPILDAQGFYLWGRYDAKGLWRNTYLGMAGFGNHKSLRKRIREELKDERCGVWRAVYSEDDLMAIRERIHEGKYRAEWIRGMRKAGTTHIVWAAAPGVPAADVKNVEADLIEALNPIANVKRPAPPRHLQDDATEVFRSLRRAIHQGRLTSFQVKVTTEKSNAAIA